MLDKLVESRNNIQENRKLRRFFIVTSTVAFGGVVFALIFSLFSQNLAMGSEAIDLSSLISPTKIAEDKPTPPEPEKKTDNKQDQNVKSEVPIRTQNILRLDESPQSVPDAISTTPSNSKARPNSDFEIGKLDFNLENSSIVNPNSTSKSDGIGDGFNNSEPKPKPIEKIEVKTPEKPKEELPPPPKPEVKKVIDTVVSGGVVNGKAKYLATPVYSAAAKAANIHGKVTVQVLIDEDGKVKSANAIDGHPLLRRDAEQAARKSSFTPTFLSENKVKVNGLIIYNFN